MAKIFKLFPENKIIKNKEVSSHESTENRHKMNIHNIVDYKTTEMNTVEPETEFNPDSKEELVAKMLKQMRDLNLTVMTEEQSIRFRTLREKMRGLRGGMSPSAYKNYYRSLSEQDIFELLPILNNLTDEDFTSRPAYAWALIDVLKEKDLAAAIKLRSETDNNEPNK